jgi:serine/threonine-protein kinase
MGAVYLAEHVKMGRKSAIKVMNPGMHQDADAIARFNREASNASRLNHPNICAIYDFGETAEGLIYLAMEFIEGKSLTALIEENGALQPARAASIVHQAADALQVAHDYGIVHRDLKPDNIMITKDRNGLDVAKVVDFGIAKASSSDAQKVTKTGLVVGTPEYMSPEQLAGDKLDGRSDIYSLALVAFNCFTGTLPFPSNSAQEAMIMRLTDQPKTLADMKPDVQWPAALQAVMDKALARDAVHRTASAAEFGRELSKAVEGMPSQAVAAEMGTMVMSAPVTPAPGGIPATRVAGKTDRASAAQAAAPTMAQAAVSAPPAAPAVRPLAAPPAEEKKGGMGMIGAIAAGVVVVAGGAWYALGGGGGKPKDPVVTPPGGTAQTTQTVVNPGGTTPQDPPPKPPVDSNPVATNPGTNPGTKNPGTKNPTTTPGTNTGGSITAALASLVHDAEDSEAKNSADVLRRAAQLQAGAKTEKEKLSLVYARALAHMKNDDAKSGCPLLRQLAPKASLIGVDAQVTGFLEYCK